MLDVNSHCQSCQLYRKTSSPNQQLLPRGCDQSPQAIVVGSLPSFKDIQNGILLSNSTAEKLEKMLVASGIAPDRVLYTSAIRCKSPGDSYRLDNELTICGQGVRALIEHHQPDHVIMLGGYALRAVFPKAPNQAHVVRFFRGSVIPYFTKAGKQIPCVFTYEPSTVSASKGDNYSQVWCDDIASVTKTRPVTVDLNPTITLCKTVDSLKECAEKLKSCKIVAWDYETIGLTPFPAMTDPALYSVAFAFPDGTAYAIPLYRFYPPNARKALQDLLYTFHYGMPDTIKIAHNMKFDLLWGITKTSDTYDYRIKGHYEDTKLLAYILNEKSITTGLKNLAFTQFGVSNWSVDVTDVRKLPLDELLHYNALDAFYTLRLWEHLKPVVDSNPAFKSVYNNLLIPSSKAFLKMELEGVPVNIAKMEEFRKQLQANLLDIEKRLRKAYPGSLSLTSPKQLGDYFKDVKKYEMLHKTPSGSVATGADQLAEIVKLYNDPVAKLALESRNINKLLGTYVDGFRGHVCRDGKVHTSFNLTDTVTGRTSSDRPAMQNFPKRRAKYIREMVVPPPEHSIVSFDYGQIEARLFAVATGDSSYLEDLYAGYDIHKEKALMIYRDNLGWSEEDAIKKRSDVKAAVFAAFYGAGGNTIAQNLGISEHLANTFKDSIFDRYTTVKEWQKEVVSRERSAGFSESLFGRRRRAPMTYTELLNFTTQSTASDMTMIALCYLYHKYRPCLMIHDDLTFFMPYGDEKQLADDSMYIIRAMLTIPWVFLSQSPLTKSFAPLQVECSIGDSWGTQEDVLKVDTVKLGLNDMDSCVSAGNKMIQELLN